MATYKWLGFPVRKAGDRKEGDERNMEPRQDSCSRLKLYLGSDNLRFWGETLLPMSKVCSEGVGSTVPHCSVGSLLDSGNCRSGRSKADPSVLPQLVSGFS